jgi:hypothetical protein
MTVGHTERCALAVVGLVAVVALAGCRANGDTSSAPGHPAAPTSATPRSALASGPLPSCALTVAQVADISGFGYLNEARELAKTSRTGGCNYRGPATAGTRLILFTFTTYDSAEAARKEYLRELAGISALQPADVPGVGDQAWVFKRLGGAAGVYTEQQLGFRKANVIVLVATNDNTPPLPPGFDTRMIALAQAVAATIA